MKNLVSEDDLKLAPFNPFSGMSDEEAVDLLATMLREEEPAVFRRACELAREFRGNAEELIAQALCGGSDTQS